MSHRHRLVMPMVARQPGSGRSSGPRSVVERSVGSQAPPTVLLPSSGAIAVASAPAPQRALALDALRVLRILRDHPRDAGPWGEPAFAREVDLVRSQLMPIRSRRGLATSFEREAFQSREFAGPREPTTMRAVRVAYALRWLELGDGILRRGWTGLVTGRG
jgi:hypothetical protein